MDAEKGHEAVTPVSAQDEKDVIKKLGQYQSLFKFGELLSSTLLEGEVRKRAISATMDLMDCATGSLYLLSEDGKELYFDVVLGPMADELRSIRFPVGKGIAGWVAEQGETVIINDTSSDPRFERSFDDKTGFQTTNMVCAPVKARGGIIGVLQAINKRDGPFTEDDREMFTYLATQVGIALDNARLYEELRKTFYETVEALAESIELRDPYTGGHTRRVKEYSIAIAREMGLSEEEIEAVAVAAVLHDVGKIGIDDTILRKPSGLTEAEFDQMKRHPAFGVSIMGHIHGLRQAVIAGMKWHHERVDGKGYPDGLKGEEIPLVARIVAVADAFDAMVSTRPYRKALSPEEAMREIDACTGAHLDAQVVAAFKKAWPVEGRA